MLPCRMIRLKTSVAWRVGGHGEIWTTSPIVRTNDQRARGCLRRSILPSIKSPSASFDAAECASRYRAVMLTASSKSAAFPHKINARKISVFVDIGTSIATAATSIAVLEKHFVMTRAILSVSLGVGFFRSITFSFQLLQELNRLLHCIVLSTGATAVKCPGQDKS